ncbi:mechanosensitive ion channel family protein [Oculatella sp. LEGE 06141]|uniref:mechanosensitive ion channel family protein n=1 Tax=Oculatella sp. LEGE 06141 TaxID=1828648 RepID=UPI00187E8F61|nr:mechanosensitive ion channel family protein [Oculatella sp. LEGE 06141]MBE9177621.1 mechanosensitive ion channel family protein [Oculatella sp. LEGE 06141]
MTIYKRSKHQVRGKRRSHTAIQVVLGATFFFVVPFTHFSALGQIGPIRDFLPSELGRFDIRPPELSNFLDSDTTGVERGDVRLDGRYLFTIAARVNAPTSVSVEQRVATVESRLQRILDSDFDPDTLEVTVEEVSSETADAQTITQPVIYATYDSIEEPLEILTITYLDATVNGTDAASSLAQVFSTLIEEALIRAQAERQPAFLRRQGLVAGGVILTLGVGSLIITAFQRRLQTERRNLDSQFRADTVRLSSTTESADAVMTALLQQQMAIRQRLSVNDIQRRLAQVSQLIIWSGGLFFALGLFPYTRLLQPIIITLIRYPIRILGVVLGTYLTVRFSAVLVDRFFWVLQNSTSFSTDAPQRLVLRFSTFSRVVKASSAVILVGIGFITALAVIGIEVGPLLAGAGIVGVAISFASQSLVKDIINGFFILLEDQYGVGDVIVVDEVAGLVENLNLRITQLRNEEGRLITIPNSAITIVQNLSKEWSRVDLMINVGHSANIDDALELINRVAKEMSRDRLWKELILESPSLLGVEKLDHTGATVRLWIKTRPLKQWDVAREYRRRLKIAFDEAGIPIGIPQQSLMFTSSLDLKGELKNAIASNGYSEPKDLKRAEQQPDSFKP